MKCMGRSLGFLAVFCSWVAMASALPVDGGSDDVKVVRPEKVYHGDAKRFTKAAVVDSQEIVRATSYYQEIVKEKLDKNSAKYWVLIRKANDAFHKVVRQVAEDEGYDLVAEEGALEAVKGKLANLTSLAKRKVEEL